MSCSDVQEVAYTIYGPCNRNSGPEAHANDDKTSGKCNSFDPFVGSPYVTNSVPVSVAFESADKPRKS